MNTHFTILVAVYNAEHLLPQCIDSILAQTDDSLQLICIDDCSTDHSADVVRGYAERDPRVVYLRTPQNSGQAVARNLGLEHAEGEFTTMVDADDWIAPDALQILWAALQEHPDTDAAAFRLIYTQDGHEWEDARMITTENCTNPVYRQPAGAPDPSMPPHVLDGRQACRLSIDWHLHGYYAVRTSIHRSLPYDTTCRLYSDDNTPRLHYLHSRRVAVTDARYFYRQHPANSTRQLTRRHFDFIEANDSLRASLEREGADADMLTRCEDYVWRHYVGTWREWHGPVVLSPDEQREVAQIFRQAFCRIKRSRLSRATRLRPCYFPWTNYTLFALWQRLLMLRHAF